MSFQLEQSVSVDNNILLNAPLVSAFTAWLVAQVLKPLINLALTGRFNAHMLLTTGGMPSSHTATVIALTTSVAIREGIGSTLFAMCVIFSIIVIHDAMGVRAEAGKQADVINEWSRFLSDIHKDGPFKPEHLKTMLGHSFSQVFAGFILGLLSGGLITLLMDLW